MQRDLGYPQIGELPADVWFSVASMSCSIKWDRFKKFLHQEMLVIWMVTIGKKSGHIRKC